jgi:hypothetical protein
MSTTALQAFLHRDALTDRLTNWELADPDTEVA